MKCNQAVICGEIVWLGTLRYTPAGIPVIDLFVKHQSRQQEAKMTRQVFCELPAVAIGEAARVVAEMDLASHVKISGFLNRKSQNNQQLVLHVNDIVKI